MNTRAQGKKGEEAAALYLLDKGFTILEKNFSTVRGEIDLIARDKDGTLVFVEVKTAFSPVGGDPSFWVNVKKQRRMGRVAAVYLSNKGKIDAACRFDVVAVLWMDGGEPCIRHYENAFMLTQDRGSLWP
jgi:putative endonuclease